MNLSALSQIEERIQQLSVAEQLWLIERVTQRIRETLVAPSISEHLLVAMAVDPDIQQELQHLAREFAPITADGVETP
jgi:hypothetical protein